MANFADFTSARLGARDVCEIDLIVVLLQLRRIIKRKLLLKNTTIDKILIVIDKAQKQSLKISEAGNRRLHQNILLEIEKEELVNKFLETRRGKIE